MKSVSVCCAQDQSSTRDHIKKNVCPQKCPQIDDSGYKGCLSSYYTASTLLGMFEGHFGFAAGLVCVSQPITEGHAAYRTDRSSLYARH